MAGINPVVDITNYSETIPDNYQVKRLFDLENYNSAIFFTYGIGDESLTLIKPATDSCYYFWSCGAAFGPSSGSPLPFISDTAWGIAGQTGIINSACGFRDKTTNCIYPKLLIPSKDLVDNGLEIGSENGNLGEFRGTFNWTVAQTNDEDITLTDDQTLDYLNVNGETDAKFVALDYKDDSGTIQSVKLHCDINSSRSDILTNYASNIHSLVGNGACLIMLDITPISYGQGSGDSLGKDWQVDIDFPSSDLSLHLDQTGSLLVNINGPNGHVVTKCNLKESVAKEQPRQYQSLGGKKPYCIVIQPVWNGIIVSNGIQDADDNSISSQYCSKFPNAHVLNPAYFNSGAGPFKPGDFLGSPKDLWGGDGSGSPLIGGSLDSGGESPVDLNFYINPLRTSDSPTDAVNLDFNEDAGLDIKFTRCKAKIAYLPLFFFPNLIIDRYYTTNLDSVILDPSNNAFRYWNWAYPLWTDNNGTFSIENYNIDTTYSNPGASLDLATSAGNGYIYSRMKYIGHTTSLDYFDRYGGQMFGQFIQFDENQHFNSFTNDGNYPIETDTFWNTASGDLKGDPSSLSKWKNYIESLSVNIGVESSSGSIVIDKFGLAGQKAIPVQNIGSLKILSYGNYPGDFTTQWDSSHPATAFGKPSGTNNILFTGIGMGAGNSESSDGANFTIPLEGRYKKLEDLELVNSPYFDGMKLKDVLDYLCVFGGLTFDHSSQYHGTSGLLDQPVVSSELLSSPLIDFSAGTSVLDAFKQICEQTYHSFYIKRDGKIHFYELGINSLPVFAGGDTSSYDWSGLYTSDDYTFIVNNRDYTPDFSQIRNHIIGFAQAEENTSGEDFKNVPLFPLTSDYTQETNPHFPWDRKLVFPVRGVFNQTSLNDLTLNHLQKISSRYLLSGSITVAGNPYIETYDRWTIEDQTYFIESVGHNFDFSSKSWTTSVTLFGDTA